MDDFLGRGRDGHHARRALAVDRHGGDGVRQAGAHRALARRVAAGRALLQGRAHDDIVDLRGIDPGTLDRVTDGVAAELLALGVVEGAAIGLADRRAGGGNDNGFAHGGAPWMRWMRRSATGRLPPIPTG